MKSLSAASFAFALALPASLLSGPTNQFDELLARSGSAWNEAQFAPCLGALREATQLAEQQLRAELLAAMPETVAGLEKAKPRRGRTDQPRLAGAIEQNYAGPGASSMQVQLSIDPPMMSMIRGRFGQGASKSTSTSRLTFGGKHAAMLRTHKATDLQEITILLDDRHLLTVRAIGLSEESFAETIDSAFVETLATILRGI